MKGITVYMLILAKLFAMKDEEHGTVMGQRTDFLRGGFIGKLLSWVWRLHGSSRFWSPPQSPENVEHLTHSRWSCLLLLLLFLLLENRKIIHLRIDCSSKCISGDFR